MLPLLVNSIPIVKLFPFWWFFSVATSLDWKSTPSSQAEQEQKSEKVASRTPSKLQQAQTYY
ncbi:hypothetical protein IIB49_01385 [Patescibacteria group bacterium]|nr:hypothetical protein [Patescibacteria group bacterium]